MLLLLALLSLQDTEAARRERVAKDLKLPDAMKRAEALPNLNQSKEPKSVALLVGALKDAVPNVRRTAAEVLGTAQDPEAAGIKPLCGVVTSKEEDPAVRLAAARSLAAAPYKEDAIDALIRAVSATGAAETNFGADLLLLLNGLGAQDFGQGRDAAARWRTWWDRTRSKIAAEDAAKRAARRKSG